MPRSSLPVASPSALSAFLGCEYRTYLDILERRKELTAERKPVQLKLLFEKGLRHEADIVERMREDGLDLVSFEEPEGLPKAERKPLEEKVAETVAAMRAGRGVIHQACFAHEGWVGFPDFLIRVEEPSDLGAWSYEVADAKLSRTPRPKYIFQLLFYDEQLRRLQGRAPARMRLMLGDLTEPEYRSQDFQAYADDIRAAFAERMVELMGETPEPAYPYPVNDCDFCHWWEYCKDKRRADDHLSLVAMLGRGQGLKLERHGVHTLEALTTLAEDEVVPRLAASSVATLRAQARLQRQAREQPTLPPPYELLEPSDGTGLARLPKPSPGDVHFDFEGDPNWGDEGLEYLFGTVYEGDDGQPVYDARWATTRAAEKAVFEEWMDWITQRLERYPDMHVFHYNAYETTALNKLVSRHSTRGPQLDDLLRREVFVDLYGITRQAVRAGVESYGLKGIETVFGFNRNPKLRGAVGSMRRWQAFLDSDGQDRTPLGEIELYNRDDCLATRGLLTWLLERRPEAEAQWDVAIDALAPKGAKLNPRDSEFYDRVEALRGPLTGALPDDEAEDTPEDRLLRLTFDLLTYHPRDNRPAWREFFARRDLSPAQMRHENGEGIGELSVINGPELVDKAWQWTLAFPEQEHKLDEGGVQDWDAERGGSIVEIDEDARTLVYRRTVKDDPAAYDQAPTRLAPTGPIKTDAQDDALVRFGERVARLGTEPAGRLDAATDLLTGRRPRFVPGTPPLTDEPFDLERLRAQVRGLDHSALMLQGPPGTGKTWTGARIAVDLMSRGLRVGVTATSHKAINNLLDAIDVAAKEASTDFRGWKKSKPDDGPTSSRFLTRTTLRVKDQADGPFDLIGATAWHWSAEAEADSIDVLLIDEAGQVSLADAIAVSQAAKSVVLLGDPQQLAHVSQGSHPLGSGASVLEHLLGDHQTIPADRGVFLQTSWRMHPDVCRFISDTMYDGRLDAVDGCDIQRVDSPGLSGNGLRMLECDHEDNRGRSPEEADLIAAEVAKLLRGGKYVSREHPEPQPLTLDDILIVAPYNVQVRCLKAKLPAGARVGTVDKFQGQEAPVVFFSMTASSGDDVTRGMSFLFSRNRLNVAVSRAQALAVVVCSPKLFTANCSTVDDMRLVNMLCRFRDVATG